MSTKETSNLAQVVLEKWGIQPADTDQQAGKADDVVCDLGKARKRRQKAQEKTDALGNALAKLQAQYVVCAEPAGLWDRNEGRLIKERGFKLRYSTPKFFPPSGNKPKALAQFFLDHPESKRCNYLSFRPGRPEIDGDHLNLWTPIQIEEIEGDVTPFLEHVDYVYDGVQEAIDFTLNWLALPLQELGTKMESAIFLAGNQGTGKTIIGDIIRHLHGYANTSKIKGEELDSQFNDYMMRATIVCVEEVCLKEKWVLMDRIKDTITSNKIRINMKHVSPYEINNVANYILNSNHANGLAISEGDRRWHPHVSHQEPKPKEYYAQFYRWLEHENGYEIIYHYLMHRDLGNFSRHTPPPMTQCKRDMIFGSKSLIEQKIYDDIQDYEGIFASDLVTMDQVILHYSSHSPGGSNRDSSAIRNAMNRLGANTGHRVRVKLKQRSGYGSFADQTGDRDDTWRIWSVRDLERWMRTPEGQKNVTAEEIRIELKKAHPDIILSEE